MRTAHSAITTATWFCMVTIASQSLTAEPPQRWTMQVVEHPDASSLVIQDINEAGDAAGFAFLGFGQAITHKPFVWQGGVPTILPTTAYWTDGYRMNEAGLCVGVDLDTGHAIHYTAGGVTDLGALGDLFGSILTFPAMNEAGQFAGYRPLGSSRYEAFTWDSKSGLITLAPEEMSSQANDINEAGAVVGYIGLYYEAKAFLYKDGVRTDFGSSWPGDTRALSIDDAGRILVEHDEDSIGTAAYQVVDAATLEILHEGPQFSADAYTEQVVADGNGDMTVAWITNPAVPHLGWWTLEDGMQEIPLPADSLQAMTTAVNSSGESVGLLLHGFYEIKAYVASLDGGMRVLNERIIGEPQTDFLSVIDINNAGQIAIQFSSNSYGACAILTPARPGDANGDGQVNGADLAIILGNWGTYPVGSVCGPDLDMDGFVDGVDLSICLGDWDVQAP
jgi:probable HAF family extracellular repeat protein